MKHHQFGRRRMPAPSEVQIGECPWIERDGKKYRRDTGQEVEIEEIGMDELLTRLRKQDPTIQAAAKCAVECVKIGMDVKQKEVDRLREILIKISAYDPNKGLVKCAPLQAVKEMYDLAVSGLGD
jgi:hypothetical protein